MRALRPSRVFVVATVMLVAGVAPPAEAQRGPGSGGGKGRNRQGDQTTRDAPSAGEYPLEGPLVLQVLNRGEGPQALAYYERTAAQAEQQGDKPAAAQEYRASLALAKSFTLAQTALDRLNGQVADVVNPN